MRTTVPIRQSGRVVIPSHLRDRLNVEYGDLVEIDVRPVEGEENDG